jgi:hypothetical protein
MRENELENEADDLRRELPEAAKRALAEAAARREQAEELAAQSAKEINGREGPDPARYGDWERKGIAIDF